MDGLIGASLLFKYIHKGIRIGFDHLFILTVIFSDKCSRAHGRILLLAIDK